MKKIGLLSIISCSVSGLAIAAGVDCNVIPTCSELGYIKTTTECDGKQTLRCPFDLTNDNAVYCTDGELCGDEYNLDVCPENGNCEECGGKQKFNGCNSGYTLADSNVCCSDEYYNLTTEPANATFEQCGNKYHFTGCEEGYTEENESCVLLTGQGCDVIGDILYDDLNCYDTTPDGKTAIGVVFDLENTLAIELANTTTPWGPQGVDILDLTNFTTSEEALASETDGKENTLKIVTTLGYGTNYAAGHCYNLSAGNLATGSWFLPSLKELTTLFSNNTAVANSLSSIGGTEIVNNPHRSSNEYNANQVWFTRTTGPSYSDKDTEGYYSAWYTRCAVNYGTPTYYLTTCPQNGICSEQNGKFKLESCNDGYTIAFGTCVSLQPKTCDVGDILYDDFKCYTVEQSEKTAIGVVFDSTNKLAVGLTKSNALYWSSDSSYDISGLTNFTSSSTALADTTGGKENTTAIMAETGYAQAAEYCYNLTTAGLPTGSWFLPSVKELKTMYDNKNFLNHVIGTVEGSRFSSGFYWSSNEASSSNAWYIDMSGGTLSSQKKNYSYSTIYALCAIEF